jgi:hypothetical protein
MFDPIGGGPGSLLSRIRRDDLNLLSLENVAEGGRGGHDVCCHRGRCGLAITRRNRFSDANILRGGDDHRTGEQVVRGARQFVARHGDHRSGSPRVVAKGRCVWRTMSTEPTKLSEDPTINHARCGVRTRNASPSNSQSQT